MPEAAPGAADLLVVGAGPAGTAAAITAAGAGLSVVLVERHAAARIQPGETLHPGAEPLFERLGVGAEVAAAAPIRHEGHWIEWHGPRRFDAFGADEQGPWRGFQVPRQRLQEILIERARRLGVSVLQPARALAPLFGDNGRVAGVLTDRGPWLARFVIDASGGAAWLARARGDGSRRFSPPLVAWFGWAEAEGTAADRFAAPSLVADENGWTWIAQVAPERCAWVRLEVRAPARRMSGAAVTVPGLDASGPVRGADVTWRAPACAAGPGYCRAGDAAVILDPCSSHGVLRALMTGMAAAHRVLRVVKLNAPEGHELEQYDHWLQRWTDHDRDRLRSLYVPFDGAWTPASRE